MIIEMLACAPYVNTGATLYTTSFTTETISPADASCYVSVGSNGLFYAKDTTGNLQRWTWLTGEGTPGDYEVRCTDNSGNIAGEAYGFNLINSAVGQWLSPARTACAWGVYRPSDIAGQQTVGVITLEIRSALDGRVLTTGTITMNSKVV